MCTLLYELRQTWHMWFLKHDSSNAQKGGDIEFTKFPLLFTGYDWILLFYLYLGVAKGFTRRPISEITRNMLPGSTSMLWKSDAGRDMACCAEPSL